MSVNRILLTVLLGVILLQLNAKDSQLVDSLKSVWHDKSNHDTIRINALNDLAWDGYLFSQPDSAEYFAQLQHDFAKETVRTLQDGQYYYLHQMGSALNTVGASYFLRGEYDKAALNYRKSLEIREEIGDKKGVSSSLKNLSNIMAEQGDYTSALRYQERGLALSEEIEDIRMKASVLNDMGVLFKKQGYHSKAIAKYMKCLEIWEELGEEQWMAAALNNIGNIYFDQGEHESAAAHYEQALKIRKKLDQKTGVINSLNSLGHVCLRAARDAKDDPIRAKNQLALGSEYYGQGLNLAQESGNKQEIAIALNGLGNIMAEHGDYEGAMAQFEEALKLRLEMESLVPIAKSYNLMSGAHLQMGRKALKNGQGSEAGGHFKRAAILSNKSLEISNQVDNLSQKMNSSELLYEAYKELGNKIAALEYYELYVSSKEAILSEENQRDVIRQEFKFAYDQRSLKDSLQMIVEREQMAQKEATMQADIDNRNLWILMLVSAFLATLAIVFLIRLNARRKKAAQEAEANALKLKTAESEMKALRSQMNPHFIFNALQSIQTFLINRKTSDAEAYLLKFSKLMRAVLENSMHEEVSIERDTRALELYMELESIRLKYPFSYSINISEEVDEELDTIPPLILQPLVENAIWHGLQHKDAPGHISIKIEKAENVLVCVVEDNGIGRKASQAILEHASVNKESLGMKITEDRLRVRNEMTATNSRFKVFDLNDSSGKSLGTKVELLIPTAA